ncbi:MAG: DNA ligase [Planctomycetes bacterium]|nr:DNA ligase [Planctomycetota bacterium]
MPRDLADGESTEVQGSAKQPYVLTNTGGVYSCTCPAWRHQSVAIEQRTCKHLRKLRGDEAEQARLGAGVALRQQRATASDASKPPVLLAHAWDNAQDLTGWWISEKLDGVRAWWDGERFLSRLGNEFLAPAWFVKELPPEPLDGELWVGRGEFQRTVSIVRRGDRSEHWKQLAFRVFDAPQHGGGFEERLGHLEALLGEGHPHAGVVPHAECTGEQHLREELARVEGLGGEGLMLRQPGSAYEAGRSTTLLKVKTFFDAEARVVDHVPGRGRHKGRLGSLSVVTPDGVAFSVGTGFSDKQREAPPPVGAIVTYRYQELTKAGVPRFPSFLRERPDAEWPAQTAATKQKASKKAPAKRRARAAEAHTAATKQKASKKAPAKRHVAAADPGQGSARRFEFVEGSSRKFWEITVHGDAHTVRYGRIGSDGQTKTKAFGGAAAAQADAEKLIAKKTAKGYVERAGG